MTETLAISISVISLYFASRSWAIARDRRHEELEPRIEVDTTTSVVTRGGAETLRAWSLTIANNGPHTYRRVTWQLIPCTHGNEHILGLVVDGQLRTRGEIDSFGVGQVKQYGFAGRPSQNSQVGATVDGHGRFRFKVEAGIRFWTKRTWTFIRDFDFANIPVAVVINCAIGHKNSVVLIGQELPAGATVMKSQSCGECSEIVSAEFKWVPNT